MSGEKIWRELPTRLLGWYDKNARALPWREEPTPYRVWVSEIMLQQTRVSAVMPYYQRFLEALPTVDSLAHAPEEQLLKLWEGLGYYNRVRNLQKAALEIMERYGGELPGDYQSLLSLPGIGEYTAGAIASIAFGLPEPGVDGNVLRVCSRLLGSREDVGNPGVKAEMGEQLRRIMPRERAGDFTQAMMELGALVCLPNGKPLCEECPLQEICCGYREGIQEELPVKAGKKARRIEEHTLFLLKSGGRIALKKRPDSGLLAGLWELPQVEKRLRKEEALFHLGGLGLSVKSIRKLPSAKHVFSHVEWRMTAWEAEVEDKPGDFLWADRKALETEVPLPSAFKAYFPYFWERKN